MEPCRIHAHDALCVDYDVLPKYKGIFECFLACYESEDDGQKAIALNCLKFLRLACAIGKIYQNEIMSMEYFLSKIKSILDNEEVHKSIRKSSLLLLAVLCKDNRPNQDLMFKEFKDFLLESIKSNTIHTSAATLIMYNSYTYMFPIGPNAQELLEVILSNIEMNRLCQQETNLRVSIFLEYLMCKRNEIVDGYKRISCEKKVIFLRFMKEYEHEKVCLDPPLHPGLFEHLLADFKNKSDCVLKTVDSYLDQENTEEMFTLLMFISDVTFLESYDSFLRTDSALFLNMGCLLYQLEYIEKNKNANIFTSVQKIEEIVNIKEGTSDLNIEQGKSFSLKASLVKGLANLAYKNEKNQNLARETGIITTILECINSDASNPLKEWSILAIRNLCDTNSENQKFVTSLTKVGDAESTSVTDSTSGRKIYWIDFDSST
ncbi:ataxin-10-like isoform X2 [Toxorhynchites rutilus septentrionalis]|uniref:ataxin-10-like isoform X2 n=1 Tax=Toxorhynchites rutilus septentrionalis TaxID=329112 RepID=UPI00247B01E9|nr:ataxin-10-like isoform X2 [Toxorhynchites rutilus septentrionalis]